MALTPFSATSHVVDVERYNQTALASQTTVYNTICRNASTFVRYLPVGRSLIEVGVQTEASDKLVHRVAVISFNNTSSDGSINFYVSYHKYQQRTPLTSSRVEDLSSAALSTSTALAASSAATTAISSSSSAGADSAHRLVPVTPTREALAHQGVAFGCGIGPKTDYPDGVLKAYEEVFGNSLPVPSDGSKVVQTHFYITTLTPTPAHIEMHYKGKLGPLWLETIAFEQQDLGDGLKVTRCPKFALSSTCMGYTPLFEEFKYSLQVAQGRAIPRSIPTTAEGVSLSAEGSVRSNQIQPPTRPQGALE